MVLPSMKRQLKNVLNMESYSQRSFSHINHLLQPVCLSKTCIDLSVNSFRSVGDANVNEQQQ